jgi:hypothetical protein
VPAQEGDALRHRPPVAPAGVDLGEQKVEEPTVAQLAREPKPGGVRGLLLSAPCRQRSCS